jgi:hypothetical protein
MAITPQPPHGGLFREFGDVPEEIAREEEASRRAHDARDEEQPKEHRKGSHRRWLRFLRRR